MAKKRPSGQQQLVVSAAHNPLPIIKDHNSSKDVLLDTGSQVTLWPATAAERLHPEESTAHLVAANNTHIPTYGKR